jgi:hypothetical protein
MNGTTLRIATAVACVAALAAPGSALAAKKKHRVSHKAQAVVVPHKYDAGGDGIELTTPAPGVHVNLFDPVQLATSLGNTALSQLGLPPLPAVPTL